MKSYVITVNGTAYEVTVEETGSVSAPVAAAPVAAAPKAAGAGSTPRRHRGIPVCWHSAVADDTEALPGFSPATKLSSRQIPAGADRENETSKRTPVHGSAAFPHVLFPAQKTRNLRAVNDTHSLPPADTHLLLS